MKKYLALILAFLAPLMLVHTVQALSPQALLEIKGPGFELRLSAAQMQELPQETFTTTNISSSGQVTDVTVTGFSLTSLLREHGLDLAGIASINLIASDEYVMSAPAETYAGADVYIMLKRDGEDLEFPRSCLPGERSMYWVKNLAKIELLGDAASETMDAHVRSIHFFRQAAEELEAVELNNRGYKVQAHSLACFFEALGCEIPNSPVTIIARDGHVKTEMAELFLASYVTLEAEPGREADLPLYFSEEMSLGMRVKQLELVIADQVAVFFGVETAVADLFDQVQMEEAESYLFVGSDGFTVEIPAKAIPYGTIYPDEKKGYTRAKFDGYDLSALPGGGKVKYLVAIEACN